MNRVKTHLHDEELSVTKGVISRSLTILPWVIISIGIVLRLIQYLINRSLWLDESYLVLNIINKSFSELLKPLDYNQVAPIGFLIGEKLNVQLLGNNEYVLRLFPLIAGVGALFLFYIVAKRVLTHGALLVALGLFALSRSLIYYSSEVKQYSGDVAVALIVLAAALYIEKRSLNLGNMLMYAAAGGLAIWFSNTSTFVLAGTGTVLLVASLLKKEWGRTAKLAAIFLAWCFSFALYYVYLIVPINNSSIAAHMQWYWGDISGTFMPFPPLSLSDLLWYIKTFFDVFSYPVGIGLPGIAALAFLIGCVSLYKRDTQRFFILLAPVFVTLIASGLHMYPFFERLIIFLVPFLLLFVAEGADTIREKTKLSFPVLGILLLGLLFSHGVLSAAYHMATLTPFKAAPIQDIKPVLAYVKKHRTTDDAIYLFHFSEYAFKYYAKKYGFQEGECLVGKFTKFNKDDYMSDVKKIIGKKRVWLIFSHTFQNDGFDEEKVFTHHLDSLGKRLDYFRTKGAACYLYELNKEDKSLNQPDCEKRVHSAEGL